MDKGYYRNFRFKWYFRFIRSQSTIKMDKGYYTASLFTSAKGTLLSQSTIKMDKGYYLFCFKSSVGFPDKVAIHNKNGQGLLHI